MELTRLKVEFAIEQIIALNESEANAFLGFIEFMVDQKARIGNNPEVAHYMGQYYAEILLTLPQQLRGYNAAAYNLMGDVITRRLNVRPETRGLVWSFLRALFG